MYQQIANWLSVGQLLILMSNVWPALPLVPLIVGKC